MASYYCLIIFNYFLQKTQVLIPAAMNDVYAELVVLESPVTSSLRWLINIRLKEDFKTNDISGGLLVIIFMGCMTCWKHLILLSY